MTKSAASAPMTIGVCSQATTRPSRGACTHVLPTMSFGFGCQMSGAVRLSPAILTRRVAEGRREARSLGDRLLAALRGNTRGHRARLERDARRVTPVSLLRRHAFLGEKLAALTQRADRSIDVGLERRDSRLAQVERLIDTLSHQSVLARGFALISPFL